MPSNNFHKTTFKGDDPFIKFTEGAGVTQEEVFEQDGLERIIQNWGEQLAAQMRINLLKNKTNASQTLSGSIANVLNQTPQGYQLDTQAEDYATFVENGRRAGKRPPLSAMIQYVKEKRQLQQSKYIRNAKDKVKATRSLAFLIQRKIGQKGTRKQPFIVPALNKVTVQVLSDRIAQYLSRGLS